MPLSLECLPGIHDIEERAVEAGIDDLIEIGIRTAVEDAPPGARPIFHAIAARPRGIRLRKPIGAFCRPVLLPVRTIVGGLADAQISEHEPAAALRFFLKARDLPPRERRCTVIEIDDEQIGR